MKLLFEEYSYDLGYVQKVSLSTYFFICEEIQSAQVPYVGYFYSQEIKDSVFILPKVFLFEGEGDPNKKEIAFGKYVPEDIINVDDPDNPIHKDGFDKVIFGLSTWLYQAIARYQHRHPYTGIIKDAKVQNVISKKGDSSETFLDIILSLLRFDKEHRQLFTYITIVNSSGNNKIHWNKTISKVQPVFQKGAPYYTEFRNKNKSVNFDEDIIVLFYSVLEYLRQTYCFPVKADFNYDLIKPRKIQAMIDSGKGTRILRSIRKKYFTDDLVSLWKLLYTFFEKAEAVANKNYHEEALLVHSFNMVFEDMVDCLIGDDIPEIRELKDNKDGKRIDHLYEDRSLIDGSDIYFIGDSKYYLDSNIIAGQSFYKQFTYAKNIIQYNIDLFNTKGEYPRNLRYRDELTEGYNITPNFFVRGKVTSADIAGGKANYSDDHLENDGNTLPSNKHFDNRLFDRDTLLLQTYNINFLFVLIAYVARPGDKAFKEKVRRRFREDIISTFNQKYEFYKLSPKNGLSLAQFVDSHFRLLNGKIYRATDTDEYLWLALERDDISNNSKLLYSIEKDSIISGPCTI